MKLKKAMLALVCALALVVGSVMGTMAYLTSKTETVVNTFTVGNVAITLDEADIDDSTADKDRDIANSYKLIPGQTYAKDPTVHVSSTSEDCYLFVKVTNNLTSVIVDNIETQILGNGWIKTETAGVYAHEPVSKGTDVVVFENITVLDSATNESLNAVNGNQITVVAYAVQAEGLEMAEAFEAANIQ